MPSKSGYCLKTGSILADWVERNLNNEDLGRYVFSASSPLGDQVDCSIYLSNEWNIPQISFSGYLTARYRACDLDKSKDKMGDF